MMSVSICSISVRGVTVCGNAIGGSTICVTSIDRTTVGTTAICFGYPYIGDVRGMDPIK